MFDLAVLATVFAVTFVAELPDKSLFASLILGTRYRPQYVWAGVGAAFAAHVALATAAGGLLALAPHNVTEALSAALFLAGAAWMLHGARDDEEEPGPDAARLGAPQLGWWKVIATSFAVVFIGEWGDITQITTANFTARYHDPFSVAVGAVLGLWLVSGLAILVGKKLLARIPVRALRYTGAAVLGGFGCYAAVQAFL
jgi:putative Ca2+/H+ antiporter (TMEM165/GDT1 family)